MVKPNQRFARRQRRVRHTLKTTGGGRPRLTVFRSGRHIYGQVIDDARGHTVAAASTLEKTLKSDLKTGSDREAARRVGLLLAERAKEAGIAEVTFDRGGYRYHGRIKSLADGAREGGLSF